MGFSGRTGAGAPRHVSAIPDDPAEPRPGRPTIDAVFRSRAADVHRIVSRLLGPGAESADIEDLGQQVFVALHLALPRFRGDRRLSTWIYGVASRVVYRELRNRTRHRRMVESSKV